MKLSSLLESQPGVTVSRVDKPWGYELIYALSESYCGKILFVRAGASLSLQYHRRKDETIYLQRGEAVIELGTDTGSTRVLEISPGAAFHVAPGTVHRLRAKTDSTFLEVSTPHLDDVVRIEDAYGRTDAHGRAGTPNASGARNGDAT
jgi:mannose-6-phosphate isomerase